MIANTYPGKKIEDLTLLEKNTLYFYTVKHAAIHAYKLHESTWIPGEGISGVKGLMDHLRTDGASDRWLQWVALLPPFAICSPMQNTRKMLAIIEKIAPDSPGSLRTKRTNSTGSLEAKHFHANDH